MKRLSIIASAALVACACGTNNNVVITSGDLTLNINKEMHYKVESKAEGAGEYFAEYCAADLLIGDEAVISRWSLKDVQEQTCEEGKTYTLY